MQPENDLETEGYFALCLMSHHATRPVCGLAVLVCFRCPIHDMQEGSRCDSRNVVQSCHALEVYLMVGFARIQRSPWVALAKWFALMKPSFARTRRGEFTLVCETMGYGWRFCGGGHIKASWKRVRCTFICSIACDANFNPLHTAILVGNRRQFDRNFLNTVIRLFLIGCCCCNGH